MVRESLQPSVLSLQNPELGISGPAVCRAKEIAPGTDG